MSSPSSPSTSLARAREEKETGDAQRDLMSCSELWKSSRCQGHCTRLHFCCCGIPLASRLKTLLSPRSPLSCLLSFPPFPFPTLPSPFPLSPLSLPLSPISLLLSPSPRPSRPPWAPGI